MTIYVDSNQNIHLYKGDTGQIQIKGIPIDRAYTAYFSILNPDNNKIIKEISKSTSQQSYLIWNFDADFTNDLNVNSDEDTANYKYGLKICYDDDEITLIPKVKIIEGEPVFQPAPDFILHQKYIEGEE